MGWAASTTLLTPTEGTLDLGGGATVGEERGQEGLQIHPGPATRSWRGSALSGGSGPFWNPLENSLGLSMWAKVATENASFSPKGSELPISKGMQERLACVAKQG